MDAKEIAKALTEAVLAHGIGHTLVADSAEEMGKKVGELYKGILQGVVDAIQSTKEK